MYRLLVLISRTVPTALRPTMPPNFTVTNPVILRVVEGGRALLNVEFILITPLPFPPPRLH